MTSTWVCSCLCHFLNLCSFKNVLLFLPPHLKKWECPSINQRPVGSSWATVWRKSARFLDVVDERVVPPNTYPCPDIQNLWIGPYLENVSADVIKLRTLRWERPPGYSDGPSSSVKCPFKRHAEKRRRKGDHRGRYWNEPTTSPCQWPREARRDKEQNLPKSLRRERSPADTLISHFCPSEPGESTFLLC